nr:MAG TPA: hypothetical protein [Caudoviricetes sp.]
MNDERNRCVTLSLFKPLVVRLSDPQPISDFLLRHIL